MSGGSVPRWTRSLRCEDAFRSLDDYMDGALTPEQVRLVEQHLEVCAQCTEEYRFERSFIDHLRQKLQSLEIPAELKARISDRLRGEAG